MNLSFNGVQPVIDPSVYVAPGAFIIGDVVIGPESSIWFGTVVRADVHYIRIGAQTNIQDQCVLHVTGGTYPLQLGDRITVGHRAIIHGCTVEDGCLIDMGVPVEPLREVSEKELTRARYSASHYIELAEIYRREHTPEA